MPWSSDVTATPARAFGGRYVRARKRHTCNDCLEPIEPGSIYWREVWIAEGTFMPVKECIECIKSWQL